ncbi:SDR family NAD(P)-dependent oxidoreductase [Mycobacterium sp. MYCO198283]|uniref:SDR family NAD(P)-dependent oxidoreductase n=1 Tax=Mycobacterium sp. MYCO198283 TaxID=2883505 RepID=UPI001E4F28DE|nr:SDR family NAD(P)-dependent oxidoreductase [Mycobacterium sp. MYCO198283]MCG5434414.1 SDR family NAD(P)-dependent oxidoreductase [Mycobacterium sp. MYCO198283]
MAGRTIVITGASDGIGAAAAQRLHRSGEQVVIVGRSPHKTQALADRLGVDCALVDYAELSSVRALARTLLARYPRIDVLANNAGGLASRHRTTVDGHELTFQLNVLAPFLLTRLLLDRLIASRAAVLNTTSSANRLGREYADPPRDGPYRAARAYADAKLAVVMLTRELHRRHHASGLTTAAFHPGLVASNIATTAESPLLTTLYRTPLRSMVLTPEEGSDELVWLASARPDVDWVSGEYYRRHRVGRANRRAYDAGRCQRLWERCTAQLAAEEEGASS